MKSLLSILILALLTGPLWAQVTESPLSTSAILSRDNRAGYVINADLSITTYKRISGAYSYSNIATGISQAVADARYPLLTGAYSNPAFVASLAFSKLTGTPTTRAGYGITDAEPTITAGTTGQYYRGDKTFQTLNNTAVGLGNVANSLQVINAGGFVSEGAGTLASRPTAGTAGRQYYATDNSTTYYDNGTAWGVVQAQITGDVAIAQGATTATLATVNGSPGTFGSANTVPVITVNAKGLTPTITTATITAAAIGAQTPQTTLSGYGITDAEKFVTAATYAAMNALTVAANTFIRVRVTADEVYGDSFTWYKVFADSGGVVHADREIVNHEK